MRLWKRFGGEPFMVNPRLGILGAFINPRKKGKKMAKRSSKAHMAYVRSFRKGGSKRRKRSARRNPFPVAGLVVNPRRHRRARRNLPMIVNRRRRYRRNPQIGGFNIPSITPILYAAAGYAGAVALEHFLTATKVNADGTTTAPLIPVSVTGSTVGKYAVRVGCVIATAYLAKMSVGADKAKMIGLGGGVYVLTSAVKEFAPSMVPGMAAYRPTLNGMSIYRPTLNGMAGGGRAAQNLQFRNDMDRSQRM